MVLSENLLTLLKKNASILNHHRNKYLLIYFSPFLIFFILTILQSWSNHLLEWQNSNPAEYSVSAIPKCHGEDCLTLGYIVSGKREPYIDSVLSHIKKVNNFTQSDVVQIKIDKKQIMADLQKHPNKTQMIIIFCTNQSWQINQIEIPCYADEYHLNFYTILYNISLNHRTPYMGNLKEAYPKDMVTVKLKKDIDDAIIMFYNPAAQIDTKFVDFPSRTSRFIKGVSIVAQYGPFFLMIPYLILLVMQASHLFHQKQKKLRIGLNIVGVTHFQFYLSEILTFSFSVIVISIMFCLGGYLFDMKFFTNSPTWFVFLTMTINGVILGLLAFIVMALVQKKTLGMSIIYGFLLYSISMQWIFSGGVILQLLYINTAGPVIKTIKAIFNIYPSFHFSKIFTDIIRKADTHLDTYQNRFVEGSQFTNADLFHRASQFYQKPFPHGYELPSAFESFCYLILTSIIYIIILCLLDILVQSNRGYRQNICKSKKRKKSFYNMMNEQQICKYVVNITNLQKTYNNNVFALRGVSMYLKEGHIIGLLGENGAGKSTLINILIGALAKSKGQVLIDEKNVQSQIVAIRKVIGVCPQFDILWEQMTAGQHISMFHKLKGFQNSQANIKKSLQSVNLYDNRNGKVSTFSGGMRRRLSLAISLIGNPKLVILDEPTTGMDAQIRLQTWKLILKLRQKKTVLITTHNMEEAQCLSDNILIMSKGRIIAEGNSVQLKKKYGEGYIVKGTNKQTNEQIVIKCGDDQLESVLQKIQKMKLQNWSLRQTTLQQVFLNVNSRF